MTTKIRNLNLAAMVAALYAMYEATIGAAIRTLTTNGSSENVFLQTMRWCFWKASAASTGQTNTAFLETVPQSVRGNVRISIDRVESYFSNPKYSGVPLATLGVNTLANCVRVLAGLGTNDQIAAFSFAKGQVAEGLISIRTEIDAADQETHGYTKAELADAFRTMPSAEAQVMYQYLNSTAIDASELQAKLAHHLAEGISTATDDAATGIGDDDSVPRVLHGFGVGDQAGFSVVQTIAEQQREQIAA